jgi:hypothetical protein
MTVICILRRSSESNPVELFVDSSAASIRMKDLFESGEEGVSLHTVEL